MLGNLTGGAQLTLDTYQQASKPCLINPTADQLAAWLEEHHVRVLNVAGSRGSRLAAQQLNGFR
ncbi:hypothetical protein GCM10027577_40800 [Spirosoma fluminis]